MKFLYIIFSIYILVLSTVTCDEEKENRNVATSQFTISDNTDSCQDEICSPFCTCSCCGCSGFHLERNPLVTISFTNPIEKKIIPYDSKFSTQFTANIWQPPKMS